MAVGWSAAAKVALQDKTCKVEWRIYIDVQSPMVPEYGVNIISITDKVLSLDRFEFATSCIDRDWTTNPTTAVVNNSDGWFCPNYFGGARQDIVNIWQMRSSGEARFRDCKLYIDQAVTLPDGSVETLRRFKGKIVELNIMDDPSAGKVAEIVARNDLLDALDHVFTTEDGFATAWSP